MVILPALLAALAVATDPVPPTQPPQASEPSAEPADLPPGSPADQALWVKAGDMTRILHFEQVKSTRLQQRLKYKGTDRALDRLVAKGGPEAKAHLVVQAELRKTWQANVDMLTQPWPVDPLRVCGYEQMYFETVLRSGEQDGPGSHLPGHRRWLSGCLEKAERVREAMSKANEDFEKAIVRAEKAVGGDGKDRPEPTPPGAPAGPTPAAPAEGSAK